MHRREKKAAFIRKVEKNNDENKIVIKIKWKNNKTIYEMKSYKIRNMEMARKMSYSGIVGERQPSTYTKYQKIALE